MVDGAPELERPTLEHGATRLSRWLRENRLKVALWIAVVEGILVLVGALPRLGALLVALLVIAAYFALARRLAAPALRQLAWIAAASQALVALVPILAIVVGTLALIAVGLIAVVALVLLLGDRR